MGAGSSPRVNLRGRIGPVVCMISNRHRLGNGWQDALVDRVHVAARCGVHLIQIREPDIDCRALLRVVERCVDAVRGSSARLIVNERADVTLAALAHGVHLRATSYPAYRVRRLVGTDRVVGRSVHSLDEVTLADTQGGLDYLIFGTVFETVSKTGVRAAGADRLAAVVRATTLPVLAVGGITARTAAAVAGAGAAGFAAVGLFADSPIEGLGDVVGATIEAFVSAPSGR